MTTTTELKALSKTLKNTFTYNKVSSLLTNIITDNSFFDKLTKIIGKKGTKTIKQHESDQMAANALGFNDFNTAIDVLTKKESLSLSEVKRILNNLELNNYKNDLLSFQQFFNKERTYFQTAIKDVVEEMQGEPEFNDEEGYTYCKEYLLFKEGLTSYFKLDLIDIIVKSEYLGDNEYDVEYTLFFKNENTIKLSCKIKSDTEFCTVDYIFEDTIEIDDENLTQYSEFCLSEQQDFFIEFLQGLASVTFIMNIEKKGHIDENSLKKISSILYDFQ